MKQRVLLVGTSFSAAPLLLALKALGFHVAVCGARPADPCVAYADAYHQLDYSDAEALLDLAESGSFDYLCPSCNDYAYLSAAHVAQRLGFPGYDRQEVATILHNKVQFREFCARHDIPSPRALRLGGSDSAPADGLHPPLLVKPADSFSGRGVTRIDDLAKLSESLARALAESRSSAVLLEEFVEGSLHSHSAFLDGGEIVQDFFVDEYCQVYPYQVDCSNSPSRLPPPIRDQVRQSIRKLAQQLGLVDGLLHTQFIFTGSGFAVIECMRRCPGDLFYHLVHYSTGYAYVENYVAPFVGRPCLAQAPKDLGYWARHTVSFHRDTVFWSLGAALPGTEARVFPLCESAGLIREAPYGKAAILFARFDDPETLFRITPNIREFLTLEATEASHAQHG